MDYQDVRVTRSEDVVTITMDRPERRNALSTAHLTELVHAFTAAGDSDALAIVLAGEGKVFSAGHDFADVAGADEQQVRRMLDTCTELMLLLHQVPQPVVARVHGLATAAGCQLVASADLAVAAESARLRRAGREGRLVLPHADGGHRPQRRTQAGDGARAVG